MKRRFRNFILLYMTLFFAIGLASCAQQVAQEMEAKPVKPMPSNATDDQTRGGQTVSGFLAKADSGQLSGTWMLKHNNVPEPYTTVLNVQEGRVTGYTMFDGRKFSVIGAVYADGRIAFTVGRTNDHSGRIESDNRITGSWTNKTGRSGTFVMER